MERTLVFALLFSAATVEVALRTPTGAEQSSAFSNSEEGFAAFEQWLVSSVMVEEDAVAHSCVATVGPMSDSVLSSPFLQFAYDYANNTFVWSGERLNSLGGLQPTARAMLQACAAEHHAS